MAAEFSKRLYAFNVALHHHLTEELDATNYNNIFASIKEVNNCEKVFIKYAWTVLVLREIVLE